MLAKQEVRKESPERSLASANTLKSTLSDPLQRAMDLAQEKGASSWLTTLPLDEFGVSPFTRESSETH